MSAGQNDFVQGETAEAAVMGVTVGDGVGAVPRGRVKERHLPGEEGLWVFIFGDLVVFAVIFGVIVVSRSQQPEVFAESQRALHSSLAALNTVLLLTGSWFVARGVRAVRRQDPRGSMLFAGALGTAVGFAAVKVVEYSLLVRDGHTLASNDFFMYYFVFTGIHLAHLLIGAVLLVCLLMLARRPAVTAGQFRFTEGAAVYWHLVDMLWLVLFPLLYVVR